MGIRLYALVWTVVIVVFTSPALHAQTDVKSRKITGQLITLERSVGAAASGQTVVIEAVASGSITPLQQDLVALGFQPISTTNRTVSGRLPVAAISQMDGLTSLAFAYLPIADQHAGSVDSEADATLKTDVVRQEFGVDGSGITIGVISDTYDCLGGAADDVTTGDLPADVHVLLEGDCGNATDEGRAMLQLIHDLAPGADLLFHTGDYGEATFAQGINDLREAGADVIVDDLVYLSEAFYQDDLVTQAADEAARQGVAYFSSAGNGATQSYQAAFRPGSSDSRGTLHDFDPGPDVDTTQRVTLPPNNDVLLSFQWDDPHFSVSGMPGAATDMDIYVYDTSGTFVTAGLFFNIGSDAFELLVIENNTSLERAVDIVIVNAGGPDPSRIQYVYFDPLTIDEYATDSPTSFGHANGSLTAGVAASAFYNSPPFTTTPIGNSFTALGGIPILFDVNGTRLGTPELRSQPRFMASDGISTTFFGADTDNNPITPPLFFGTSAAAPNAAAVAALLLECVPTLTPQTIYDVLAATALDADPSNGSAPGYDSFTGAGLIQADAAASWICGLSRYDLNDDDFITPADALAAINQIGATGTNRADVDFNGNVDENDIHAITDRIGQAVD